MRYQTEARKGTPEWLAAHAHCTSTNTPCFTAGGIFMPNSQIRFSGPFSRAPNLPYQGYPERLSTARTVTI